MAPRTLRDLSPYSFSPRVVSIGLLHRDNANVQAFERHKSTYLIYLMSHMISQQEIIMNSCMKKVYASMEKIKACYVLTKTYDDVEFAKMMVMDACFILGFILQCTIAELDLGMSLVAFMSPVLLMLDLFDSDAVLGITESISVNDIHHILSLLHECYKPKKDVINSEESLSTRRHSAVDLDKAGVSFKPNRSQTWVLGMEMEFPCFLLSWCSSPAQEHPSIELPALPMSTLVDITAPLCQSY
ncbi:hypothetical protein E3N88_31685 [Mikania micrantha]|uniref:Uncharacterized protein n=1 Tax=Mikania micrantha TaxID=192012 RepID=A0A5N6M6X1_9ASTR|nr:hypothetical protein E3N88_31685 [Mikania micrantha]